MLNWRTLLATPPEIPTRPLISPKYSKWEDGRTFTHIGDIREIQQPEPIPLHPADTSPENDVSPEMPPTYPQEEALTECASLPPPIQSGWLVAYRDQRGALCGGCDDRQHGTVDACRWDGNGWTLCLTDGQEMPLSQVRSVGQTDEAGQIVAAWTVRKHGYDGGESVERRWRAE